MKLTDESWISYQQGKGNEEYQKYMEDLTEEREEVLRIWNDLNTNEQETVMSMLHGLRKQENSSSIFIGCSFFVFGHQNGNVFLVHSRTLKYNKISFFWHKFKSYIYNKEIGKPDESLGRKATGPVKWQPVA